MKFTNGRHCYYGKFNSSGRRKMSKIYKGMTVDKYKLSSAFSLIQAEKTQHIDKIEKMCIMDCGVNIK